MAVRGPTNKNKHWQYIVQGDAYIAPGTYDNATVTINEYGQILNISSSALAVISVVGTPPDLATIVNPANGDIAVVLNNDGTGSEAMYIYNGTIWNLVADSNLILGKGNVNETSINNIGLSPIINLGAPIPGNSIIKRVHMSITSAYSVGTTIEVQDGGGTVYMSTAQLNPEVIDNFKVELPDNTSVVGWGQGQMVVVVGGAPVTGNADVYLEYIIV